MNFWWVIPSMVLMVIALLVMPDGPFWRKFFALVLAGASNYFWNLVIK